MSTFDNMTPEEFARLPVADPESPRARLQELIAADLPEMDPREAARIADRLVVEGGAKLGLGGQIVRACPEVWQRHGVAALVTPSAREAQENEARFVAAVADRKYHRPAPKELSPIEKALGMTWSELL
jgi:hypothetical protein